MKRALIFVAFSLALAGAFGATQAQANTYCAELPDDASCTQNFTGLSTSIQAAVDAADINPGPDRVKVGPGTFVMSSPVYLSNFGAGNPLTLTGSGANTILQGSDPEAPGIHFEGGTGSSINNLTVSIPDDASDEYKIGLALDSGVTGNGLNVTFAQHLVDGDPSPGNRTTGVWLADGATLEDSTVRLYSSNVNDAVAVSGSGNIVNSTLTSFRDVYQRNATGTVEIKRSALIAIGGGVVTEGGTMNIRDSVILNPFGSGDGIYVTSSKGSANVLIDGSTILGAPGSTGAVVQAVKRDDENPGVTDFRLNNSIVYGQDYAVVYREYFAEDTLTMNLDSSAYDSSRVVEQVGAGTPQVTIKDPVELNGVDPKFNDPGNGDYSLAPGSPLIDAGQAALPAAGSLSYDGNPRACDGNDDGVIRRDIGAYEYRSDPNDDCTYPVTSISAKPQKNTTAKSAHFEFSSNKPSSTFLCALDSAPEKPCSSPYDSTSLAVGDHTFSVRAKDRYGNIEQSPATYTWNVKDDGTGPCGPSCSKDTTPPKVTGVKAPKQTKLARIKVRFKSNEKGSTFKCRLNKGKWKSCKSPWKTPKLRKGKNTISIQATDKAGNKSKVKKIKIRRR